MTTKVSTKKAVSMKAISKGANVNKQSKEVSKYKLMLDAYKESKAELFSLSGAIRCFKSETETAQKFLQSVKLTSDKINPSFILSNATKVKRFKMVKNELYTTVYKNKVATDILKVKWSLWDVVNIVRSSAN